MGWLTGWTCRKLHNLTGATGAGTLYTMRVIVHYGAGSDSGEDVYCNSKCKTDFGDIRFTDNDETTLLKYWLESKTDGVSATFWVQVTDDLTSDQSIYIYYENTGASTTSDIKTAFLLGDDFDDNVIDPALWTTWTSGQGITVVETGGEIKISGTGTATNAGARLISLSTFAESMVITVSTKLSGTGTGYMCKQQIYQDDNNYEASYPIIWSAPTLNALLRWEQTDGGVYQDGILDDTDLDGAYHTYKFIFIRSAGTVEFFRDDVSKGTKTCNGLKTGSFYLRFWDFVRVATDTIDARHDTFYARKYVSPEPAHGTWESAETYAQLSASFTIRKSSSKTISSSFTIRKSASIKLSASVTIRHSAETNLSAEIIIQNIGSITLSSSFTVRHSASQDLSASVLIRNVGFTDLSSSVVIRHEAFVNISSIIIIQNRGFAELSASVIVQNKDDVSLSASFTVRHSDFARLSSSFTVQHSAYVRLSASATIRHTGTITLSASMTVRHKSSANLSGMLYPIRRVKYSELSTFTNVDTVLSIKER